MPLVDFVSVALIVPYWAFDGHSTMSHATRRWTVASRSLFRPHGLAPSTNDRVKTFK